MRILHCQHQRNVFFQPPGALFAGSVTTSAFPAGLYIIVGLLGP
jgi:hypothetical protein